MAWPRLTALAICRDRQRAGIKTRLVNRLRAETTDPILHFGFSSGLTGTKESDWGFPEADWCASLGECAMVSLSPCPKPTANV